METDIQTVFTVVEVMIPALGATNSSKGSLALVSAML